MTKLDQLRVNILLSRFGMRGDILLQRLRQIKEQAYHDRSYLETQNPAWDSEQDARLKCLQKLINVFDRTQFQIFILEKLLDNDWYQANLKDETQQAQDYKVMLTVELEITTKYSFGLSLFTLLESYFRIFLRALDMTACNGATNAFASVSACLLGSRELDLPSAERSAADELLNFVRLIRNLIHNDGVFFSEDGRDKIVNYRDLRYAFRHGQHVDFVYWELLLNLADDIRKLLFKIITHFKIMQISLVAESASFTSR